MATNKAAYLVKAGTPLEVKDAPLPTAGPLELVIKNHAIAINPLDTHMQKSGVFVQQWPTILGCDVAGEVYEVGSEVDDRFKKGDRVIGHAINLTTGHPRDGAFALYTVIRASKAAILPASISFTDGVVVPFALEAAVCALSVSAPGTAMPDIPTPALGLPYPSLTAVPSLNKTLLVYGGSASVGSMTIQVATAAGISVLAVASKEHAELSRSCGAEHVFDYRDAEFVSKIITTIRDSGNEFIGIFDAVSSPETYTHDLAILAALGGGHLACVHPPPPREAVPGNVRAGMIFAVDEVAGPVFRDWVTGALEMGMLKTLPRARVVGRGLEALQRGLDVCGEGVRAAKVVVGL